MVGRRGAILLTAAVLAGAAGGAGGYAMLAGDGGGAATPAAPTSAVTATTPEASAAPAPVAATTGGNLSVSELYRRASSGVVEVTASVPSGSPVGGGRAQAQGSGFTLDGDGHIVTNLHVVQGASSVRITFADGSKYDAAVVGRDASTDLAVLRVSAPSSELHPLPLGDSARVVVGQPVVAIGSPFGVAETVTSGIVSAVHRTISSDTSYSITGAIQTDAAINHGNSGGPLLDMRANVIGVTSQIASANGGSNGVGFAIPSDTVRAVTAQLLQGGTVRHAYLGVSVSDATARAGAQVGKVTAGSPAASAGLRAGDVVTAIGDTRTASADALTAAVASHRPGDRVTVAYERGGSARTATVTLGNHP